MYYIYVIQHTKTKQIYVGITNDLKRRLREHNTGRQKATLRKEGK